MGNQLQIIAGLVVLYYIKLIEKLREIGEAQGFLQKKSFNFIDQEKHVDIMTGDEIMKIVKKSNQKKEEYSLLNSGMEEDDTNEGEMDEINKELMEVSQTLSADSDSDNEEEFQKLKEECLDVKP